MINENVWSSLNLKIHVTAKREYSLESNSIEISTGSPAFVGDIAIAIKRGKKVTHTIINRNEMESLRDHLDFILENTKPEK
jgi:hypothetical protein